MLHSIGKNKSDHWSVREVKVVAEETSSLGKGRGGGAVWGKSAIGQR